MSSLKIMSSLKRKKIRNIQEFLLGIVLSLLVMSIWLFPHDAWTACAPGINLPAAPVTMKLYPGTNGYFNTALSNVPSGYHVTNGTYPGWCAEQNIGIRYLFNYQVILFSSYDPGLPAYLQDPDWDKVNYIINHKQGTATDVQEAMWYFVDGGNLPSNAEGQAMVNDALANGTGFCPVHGQSVAVICAILDAYGQFDTTIQANYVEVPVPCTCFIGDFVWHDLNRNGIQDTGEPGIGGVTVYLKDSVGTVIMATTATGASGYYQFTGLCAGAYLVEVVTPTGFLPTISDAPSATQDNDSNGSPDTVILATDDSSDQTIDFGYIIPCTGSIGDFVWHDLNRNGIQDADEPGIDGVMLQLKDSSGSIMTTTTTDVSGYYQFTGLCAGDYTVEAVTPGGFTSTISHAPGSTVANDSNSSPALVSLATDTSSDQTLDFGFVSPCTGSIGDFVWHDLNRNGIQDIGEPGIDGVTVYLKDSSGSVMTTTTTDVSGYYQFTGLCAGDYTVEAVTPGGFTSTISHAPASTAANDSNSSPASVSLATDASSDQTIDFGYYPLPLEGCTLGFWKNHVSCWYLTGYKPTDTFNEVFGVNAFDSDLTLLRALKLGGGGLKKLARQGTAALLDASHPYVNYPMSETGLIDAVRNAILSGEYEPLASQLDDYNNLNCQLSTNNCN